MPPPVENMDGFIARIKQSAISHLLLAITFFTSGLIINFVQCIMYCLIRPASKYVYRKLNYYVEFSLYSQLVFLAEWWSGSDVMIYIDKEDFDKFYGKEHGYLIMNHAYDIDWLMGWVFCDRIRLLGNCKTYAKKVLQYIPTMGFAWKFGESVFLERNWDKDKAIIGKQLTQLVQYPDPMWLLMFAEGTRFSEHKHEASMKFAKERGLPILKHHLVPRTRGFISSVPYLKGKVPAIYDVQLAFTRSDIPRASMNTLLMGKPIVGHMFIQRIPLEQVPEGDTECANWLIELYQRKDRMQDSFLKTGDFFELSGEKRVEGFLLPRRWHSLVNTTTWSILVLVPMTYFLLCMLTSGSTIYFSIAAAIIACFFYLLYKIIGMTQTSKASSYGSENSKSRSKTD